MVSKYKKVFVKIINEPVPAWEPVNAIYVKNNIYELIDLNNSYNEEFNKWEFPPGTFVKCELKPLTGVENKKENCFVVVGSVEK
jgi:hypothetical protein